MKARLFKVSWIGRYYDRREFFVPVVSWSPGSDRRPVRPYQSRPRVGMQVPRRTGAHNARR
jgi:hypothetical protein